MRVIHTTSRRNLASIMDHGILTTYARQGRIAVWVHSKRLDQWAEAHVKVRHGCEREEIIHIELEVPATWLKRHCKGVHYSYRDIPPSRIKSIRVVRTIEEELTL